MYLFFFYSFHLCGRYLFIRIYSFFIAPIYSAFSLRIYSFFYSSCLFRHYLFTYIHSFFIAPIYSDFIYLDVSNLFLFGCRMAARLSLTQDKGTLPPACAA